MRESATPSVTPIDAKRTDGAARLLDCQTRVETVGGRGTVAERHTEAAIVGRSASQNAISPNFDARFERFGLFFPTIKMARANAARGANDPRYLV